MRIDIKETKVYRFDELSDTVQDQAVENLSNLNIHPDWWDGVYMDADTISLEITGFDIDRGSFCSGDWNDATLNVAGLILEHHGENCETHKDATDFIATYDQNKLAFEADKDYDPDYQEFEESDDCQELCDDFRQTILEDYRVILQKEYDHLISREAIVETIKTNEYEFTENGKLY